MNLLIQGIPFALFNLLPEESIRIAFSKSLQIHDDYVCRIMFSACGLDSFLGKVIFAVPNDVDIATIARKLSNQDLMKLFRDKLSNAKAVGLDENANL